MSFFDYLVQQQTIAAKMVAYDWKDAVSQGGALLVNASACSGKYIEAIIDSCERNGPYFVIGKGIAMPHTRPEYGAVGTGYALVTLAEPVSFGDPDNDPIDILFFMAAADSSTHVEEAMCQIADFCDNEANISKLRSFGTVPEIVQFLKTIRGTL
jgi:ascorbate PTS system EIIA or EIIAB component